MKKADKAARSVNGQQHSSAVVEKASSFAERDISSGLEAAVVVSSATDGLTEVDNLHELDAEASGQIVVKEWDAIGELGVFVGPMPITAGEVLGMLEGVIVRRRRLTRAERRRFIGIRVDGRAAHIDVEGRWPGKINHGPPSRCNTDWDPDTRIITATRDILPGEQVLFDYGVGFFVDDLTNRDYDKLSKDQRAFFDVMHAVVDNYAWLSHTMRERKLSQAMRVGIIALYLSQQCLSPRSDSVDRFSLFDDASSRAMVAVQDTNPLVQYLLHRRSSNDQHRPVLAPPLPSSPRSSDGSVVRTASIGSPMGKERPS